MIKCDLCDVEFNGSKSILMSELSTIIYTVKRGILTEDEINECVDRGLRIADKDIEKSSDDLTDMLKKILEILEG